MGSANNVAFTTVYQRVLYELRDPNGYKYNKSGSYTELNHYLNKCCEIIYEILVGMESELVGTGSGTITTVAGTQRYALSDNSMGDFWLPKRLNKNKYAVWISEYEPMEMCEEGDLYDAINANEGSLTSRSQPDRFCLIGDYIWFEYVPDDAYTVNLRYYPNFVNPSTYMPYKNLFNNEIVEGMILFAKKRNELDFGAEAILKDLFLRRALKLVRKRQHVKVRFRPNV